MHLHCHGKPHRCQRSGKGVTLARTDHGDLFVRLPVEVSDSATHCFDHVRILVFDRCLAKRREGISTLVGERCCGFDSNRGGRVFSKNASKSSYTLGINDSSQRANDPCSCAPTVDFKHLGQWCHSFPSADSTEMLHGEIPNSFVFVAQGPQESLDRLSINPPLAHVLDHSGKAELLETYSDGISELMEKAIVGKLIKIAVHTYDEHNPSRTQRPDVSLISRSVGYQRENRMPFGVFDPLYPDVLGDSMCSRTLLHRISLNLERAGFRVGHNHPWAEGVASRHGVSEQTPPAL